MGEIMKYESVKKLIDKNITDKLLNTSILDLIEDLKTRVSKFKMIMKRDFDIDFDSTIDMDIDDIEQARLRYQLYYIKHCNIRIDNFKWIIRNRLKFNRFTALQVFKLILLKEKLLITRRSNEEISNDKSIFKYDIGDELKTYIGEWTEIVAYAIVNDEPRYVVKSNTGWRSLEEVSLANPKIIKGELPKNDNFSFRLTTTEGRNIDRSGDAERLQVLLSQIKLSR